MKLAGYQQCTCLCVKMEFMVGTISLSCELYSFSWSCCRSRGSDTIVYEKWCFDLHVECCGSCMVSTIGVEGGKFVGVLRIFARIFPNLPEKFWATLPINHFPQRSWRPFLGWPPKTAFLCFSANVGRHFMKSNKVGRYFFQGFQRFCPDFQGFSAKFQEIKTFRGALAPRLLHHSLAQNFRHSSIRVWLHLQWRLGVPSE